jgi:RHS repeat-associated protein
MLVHPASGLQLTPARVFDGTSGRWLSRDPLGEAAGVNLYAYVGNNPILSIDPTGLYSCIYSVPQHYIVCTPGNSANPYFSSSNFVAGNNREDDYSGSPCQNNPACSNIENVGPLPSGSYIVGPQKSYTSRRPLTPESPKDIFGANRPGGYQTHGCGNEASCSDGCIAATRNVIRDKLNNLFNLEPNNIISVQGF